MRCCYLQRGAARAAIVVSVMTVQAHSGLDQGIDVGRHRLRERGRELLQGSQVTPNPTVGIMQLCILHSGSANPYP